MSLRPEEPLAKRIAQEAMSRAGDRLLLGPGTPQHVLQAAEARLELCFPPSYRWFLEQHGVAILDGYEVAGLAPPLYEPGAEEIPCLADIVSRSRSQQHSVVWDRSQLEILSLEGDEVFYFVTSTTPDKEWPIMVSRSEASEPALFAGNFYEFLTKVLQGGS